MQAIGTNASSTSTRRLLGALLAALLLLRSPGSLIHPQFWAEDGALFFQDAFNQGFLATALQPASGYLHSFPRLVAGLSLLFPMELAPLVFNLAAFGTQLLPALYLLSPRIDHLIPSFPARVGAALLLISLPASHETHVNITNAHWHLALAALLILVAKPAATRGVRVFEALVAGVYSLTGPFSILFLPLLAPRLLGVARRVRPARSETAALVIAAGALIQLGFAAGSARIGTAAVPTGSLSLQEVAAVVSMHAFFNTLFGSSGLASFYQSVPPIGYGLGLLALAFLLFIVARNRVWPLVMLFWLAALTIALSFLFPLNDLRYWLHPRAGPRYFLFACVFVTFALLHLAFAARRFKGLGRVLLAVVVVVGIPADFFHPPQPDVHWADQVSVFRSLPAGAKLSVPVLPLYHGGMVLHKTSAQRGQPPLARLRPITSPAPAAFSIGRPAKIGLAGASNDRHLSVAGWALDGAADGTGGGVFVLIDDRVFPAVTGLPSDVAVDGRSCTDCGFSRLIPIDEIGPGAHQATIAVIAHDGSGYYQPPTPRAFAMSDFFP